MMPDPQDNNSDSPSREELGKKYQISVVEYNSEWPSLFQQEMKYLFSLLNTDIFQKIVHIGSTAVPELIAKPVIDILIQIPSIDIGKEKGFSVRPFR